MGWTRHELGVGRAILSSGDKVGAGAPWILYRLYHFLPSGHPFDFKPCHLDIKTTPPEL